MFWEFAIDVSNSKVKIELDKNEKKRMRIACFWSVLLRNLWNMWVGCPDYVKVHTLPYCPYWACHALHMFGTMYINWVLHLWGGVHLCQSLFAFPTPALAESPEVIFFQWLTRARCTHFNFKHYIHWYIQCSLEFLWIQATTIEGHRQSPDVISSHEASIMISNIYNRT